MRAFYPYPLGYAPFLPGSGSREWGMPRREAIAMTGVATAWGAIGLIVRAVDLPAAAIVGARCSMPR